MKTYRVNEGLTLTPSRIASGNVLKLESSGGFSFDLSDESVSKILDMLIGVVFRDPQNVSADPETVTIPGFDGKLHIEIDHPEEKTYAINYYRFVDDGGGTLCNQGDRSEIVRLMNLLTHLLPTLCEEGM